MKSSKFKKKIKKIAVKHLLQISELEMELATEIARANNATRTIFELRSELALIKGELSLLHEEYDDYKSRSAEVIEVPPFENIQLSLPIKNPDSFTCYEPDESPEEFSN